MAGPYLLPEDVSDANAQTVLSFLNRAANTEEIATAVEFPGELDVGIRVAERILRRRDQLGGFSSLDQLYAVPFVGPERFTEIVVSLSEQRPPTPEPGPATVELLAELASLRRSIDELRAAVRPQVQARIWSIQDSIWLGQAANILVQLTDAAATPLVDRPITLLTEFGDLESLDGSRQRGPAVVVRTDELGMAEVRLTLRLQANLSDAQRLALERMLSRLPMSAAWPTAANKELVEFVDLYRAGGSQDLREAVDALSREYAMSLQLASNRGQALSAWHLLPAVVLGFVQEESGERGARTLASAVHRLVVRNWLPAFLATFEETAASDPRLIKELQRARERADDAARYVNDALVSVQSFLALEQGELGQAIRHRTAQAEIQQFLQTEVTQLPANVQVDVLSSLQNASKTIGDGGLTLFSAVETVRKGRLRGLNAEVDLGVLRDRMSLLERSVVTDADLSELRAGVLTEIAQRTDVRLNAFQAQVDAQLLQKADRNAVTDLGARIDAADSRMNRLDERTGRLDQSVSTLNTSVTGLNSRVDTNLTRIGSRLDGLDVRLRPG